MLLQHWFRLLLLLLYGAGVLLVLHQCSRQFNPPPPAKKHQPNTVPDAISRQERDRAARRARLEEELRQRKAAHDALEADLKALREEDLPRAVAELAREALRYQNKLSDLARLDLPARWERENPVKHARDHAYKLVLEYQSLDQNAQKERDGPTLYQDDAIALITKRLEAFRRGGEGIASFATAVPVFAGQVPERLILDCIDAITVAALPADAFDPCRNPLACPKETAPIAVAPAPAVKQKPVQFRVSTKDNLDRWLRRDPDYSRPTYELLEPRQIVELTGRRHLQPMRNGAHISWVQIKYRAGTRWVMQEILEEEDVDTHPLDRTPYGNARVPPTSLRSRKDDSFWGWIAKERR